MVVRISSIARAAVLLLAYAMPIAAQQRAGSDIATLIARGEQLIAANHIDEAASVAAQAVALQPDSGRAHYLLGLVRERQRSFDAAVAEFRVAPTHSPRLAEGHDRLW